MQSPFCEKMKLVWGPDHRQGYAERAALVAVVAERTKTTVAHEDPGMALALCLEVGGVNGRKDGAILRLGDLSIATAKASWRPAWEGVSHVGPCLAFVAKAEQ